MPGDLAVVYTTKAYTFSEGHELRASKCLLCREPVGGEEFLIAGVAALAGEPCTCGGIVSDVWLVHASHAPITPELLCDPIRRALDCDDRHH